MSSLNSDELFVVHVVKQLLIVSLSNFTSETTRALNVHSFVIFFALRATLSKKYRVLLLLHRKSSYNSVTVYFNNSNWLVNKQNSFTNFAFVICGKAR